MKSSDDGHHGTHENSHDGHKKDAHVDAHDHHSTSEAVHIAEKPFSVQGIVFRATNF